MIKLKELYPTKKACLSLCCLPILVTGMTHGHQAHDQRYETGMIWLWVFESSRKHCLLQCLETYIRERIQNGPEITGSLSSVLYSRPSIKSAEEMVSSLLSKLELLSPCLTHVLLNLEKQNKTSKTPRAIKQHLFFLQNEWKNNLTFWWGSVWWWDVINANLKTSWIENYFYCHWEVSGD